MLKFTTNSCEETALLGSRLGSLLRGGDVVCLDGGLGTGKTAFTGGIAKALGIGGYITSPTFTIVNEYMGSMPLYHFDVYRIADPEEMYEIGFDEYIEGSGAVVIEWAAMIKELLPGERIEVRMEKPPEGDGDKRLITMEFLGKRYEDYERRFAK